MRIHHNDRGDRSSHLRFPNDRQWCPDEIADSLLAAGKVVADEEVSQLKLAGRGLRAGVGQLKLVGRGSRAEVSQ